MLWGCFASTGTGNLQRIEGIMDSVRYQDIIAKNVNPSVKKLKFGRHWTFQQDNDLKHTSKSMFHCRQSILLLVRFLFILSTRGHCSKWVLYKVVKDVLMCFLSI